jgi:cytochrome P450
LSVGDGITVEDLEHDPYPHYAALRADEPVSWVPSVGLWLVTRWADVFRVVREPTVFTAATEPSTVNRTFGVNMIGSEGPVHRRVRSVVEPAFRVGAVKPYVEEIIRPIAVELIEALIKDSPGEVELMDAFATTLSVRTVKTVLGLGDVSDETLKSWFADLAMGAANFEQDPAKQAVADAASEAVDEALAPMLHAMRHDDDGSILARMLHTDVDGGHLRHGEIQANTKVMIVGGMQEPADFVGLAMHSLLSHPDQAAEVCADPGLVTAAVEEAARWHSPVGTSTRQTTEQVDLAGITLPPGALVAAVLSSANRDERHWTEPDRFDVHRDEGHHLAFSAGPHRCIGSSLAILVAQTACEELLTRLPNLRLDPAQPTEFSGWEFRRPLQLQLRWDA